MFEGFEMGTLWKMKDPSDFTTYRVMMHSTGFDDCPEVGFDRDGEMVTHPVAWVLENMVPCV